MKEISTRLQMNAKNQHPRILVPKNVYGVTTIRRDNLPAGVRGGICAAVKVACGTTTKAKEEVHTAATNQKKTTPQIIRKRREKIAMCSSKVWRHSHTNTSPAEARSGTLSS